MKTTRNMILFLACVVFTAVVGTPVRAQEKGQTALPPKLDIHTETLGNGLRVILLEDHAVPVVNLQVWYHVVSKDEEAGHTGFAHLFEHLMFKGSAHVGSEEHSRII